MTPAATVAAGGISLLSALFTATSSLSVTGLVVLDTGQDFTFFGQLVILGLIQAGGLGVLLLTTLLAMVVALRVRLERDHGDRANQSDHVGREPGNQSICRISLWPK